MPKLTTELIRRFLKKEGWGTRVNLYRRWIDQPYDSAKGNVVILHGYRGNVRAPHFKGLANAFDDVHFNVGTCDLPNFGRSEPKDERYRGQIPSFALLIKVARSMVYAMLASRSKSQHKIVLVGYSVGALVLMRFLQIYPYLQKYIAGVVFIAIPLEVAHNADAQILKYRKFIEPLFAPLAELHPHMSVAKYEPDPFSATDLEHFKGDMEAITAKEIWKAAAAARRSVERIRIPTLFIHGEDDTTAPLSAMEEAFLQIATPDDKKKKIIYPSIDHLVLQRHPKAVDDIVDWGKKCCEQAAPLPTHDEGFEEGLGARSVNHLLYVFFWAGSNLLTIFFEVVTELWLKARAWWKNLF